MFQCLDVVATLQVLAGTAVATTQEAAQPHHNLLQDIGICIIAATVLAYVARLTRQPLLLAYIGAGVLIGPLVLGWVEDQDSIQVLAELGLAFLLYIVGLEIDVKKLLATGGQAAAITLVQVAGCALLGYLAALVMGISGLPAAYVGAAVAFSSTMIVVKLLSDRSELDTLPGRVTLGILLMQDVFAIVVLAIQPYLGQDLPLVVLALAAFKGLALVAGAILASRYILPPLLRWVAASPEMMLLSAITWCFVVCGAAIKLEFSLAMGALIAGVSMSALPYTLEVAAKIQSLRDFFVTLFFVALGMLITQPTWGLLLGALGLSLVVIAGRFLTIWAMARVMGYDNRVGILSSIHLSQISEFALVIVLIGISPRLGHIEQNLVSLIVVLLIVTSTVSTYMIQGSHGIAAWLVRRLSGSSAGDTMTHTGTDQEARPAPVMLVGCFRVGSSLVTDLLAAGKAFSVIDFNTQIHAALRARGVPCIYGDISYLQTLEHAGVHEAKVLVCPIADDFLRGTSNRKLLAGLRRLNPQARIIVTADSVAAALALYEQGADYVLVPRLLASRSLVQVIGRLEGADAAGVREEEMAALRQRSELV